MQMNKQLVEEANDLAKGVKALVKSSKEMTDLVCYMRKMLDTYMVEESLWSDEKLIRAFEIMMDVQHEKDLLKELKRQSKEIKR